MKRKKKIPIRYWSIKLPKDGLSYGKLHFPTYTKEYLKKRGAKLFDLVYNRVPAELLKEFVRQIKATEKRML